MTLQTRPGTWPPSSRLFRRRSLLSQSSMGTRPRGHLPESSATSSVKSSFKLMSCCLSSMRLRIGPVNTWGAWSATTMKAALSSSGLSTL